MLVFEHLTRYLLTLNCHFAPWLQSAQTHPIITLLENSLRHDLYQNFMRNFGYEELLVQSYNDHRFQEDDFTYLLRDKMLNLHKVCVHPCTKKPRQFATAFPRKPTSWSPSIHHNGNLTQNVQEFLAILFFNGSWRLGTTLAMLNYSNSEGNFPFSLHQKENFKKHLSDVVFERSTKMQHIGRIPLSLDQYCSINLY